VDYAISISQMHQADALVADWDCSTPGAVFGIAV